MNAATFERRRDGIYLEGRRVLAGKIPFASEPMAIEGTPWALSHKEEWSPGSESLVKVGDCLRLTNLDRGTDVIQIDVAGRIFRFRFHTLLTPRLANEEIRLRLYDGPEMVAEHINVWRDRDVARGILTRVETCLSGPAADAAAILLFHLADHPLAALDGDSPATFPPLGL